MKLIVIVEIAVNGLGFAVGVAALFVAPGDGSLIKKLKYK